MTTQHADMLETLERHGQSHLLTFLDRVTPHERDTLLSQISDLDLDQIDQLVDAYVRQKPDVHVPGDLAPAPYYAHRSAAYDAAMYRAAGEDLLRQGAVAAFTVAGGQGTRLGWNGPKGTFPATPVEGKPLFRVFAEQILAAEKRYGVTIPWYIMTSPANDADTRAFFADNNNFGITRRNIFMFPQGMMPSFDSEGRILLAEKHQLAMNPDGHGGSIRALAASGALEDMGGRGIKHISYFQVDNPHVRIVDPLFLGLHAHAPDSSGEISSKMLPKVAPEEKVGVFCESGGKTMVIEYSDLPDELAHQRTEDGSLRFLAGSIAIHLMSTAFVESITEGGSFGLPWHRAEKKVPHIDLATGERVEPTEPNGIKLETFVFDAIPLAASSIVYETSRLEEFAPIKNASGVDSAESSRQLQSDRAAGWLEAQGVSIARTPDGHADALIEISPLTAMEAADLAERADLPAAINSGERVSL